MKPKSAAKPKTQSLVEFYAKLVVPGLDNLLQDLDHLIELGAHIIANGNAQDKAPEGDLVKGL